MTKPPEYFIEKIKTGHIKNPHLIRAIKKLIKEDKDPKTINKTNK